MKPTIQISSYSTLVDQPVSVKLRGFRPNTQVTVRAVTDNVLGLSCTAESSAIFHTDEQGAVNLDSQAPIAGTYHGVDGMGLFWSMEMRNVKYTPTHSNDELHYQPNATIVSITAESVDGLITSATCERRFFDSDVITINVTQPNIVGKLFFKPNSPSAPGFIVLGGGEGGMASPMTFAALLASHGYPALALAYFRFEHLPPTLREIPLEYFETAIHWLKNHDSCDGRIITFGRSKGAELSLLLGTVYPEISCVISSSPTSVVSIGDSAELPNGNFATYSSWSENGQPIPFVPWTEEMCREVGVRLRKGMRIDDIHDQAMQKVDDPTVYDIAVERIQGPILLISSGDDHWWAANKHANRIMERLRRHEFAYEYRHLDYPSAGHIIRFPYLPTTQLRMNGGSPEANHIASHDSWKALLRFIERQFPV